MKRIFIWNCCVWTIYVTFQQKCKKVKILPPQQFWYIFSLEIPQSDILLVLGWYTRCSTQVLDRKQVENIYYALTHWQASSATWFHSKERREVVDSKLRSLLYPIIRVFCEWFVNLLVRDPWITMLISDSWMWWSGVRTLF